MKKLAVFDIDGTVYRWSLVIDLIDRLLQVQRIRPSHFVASQTLRKRWEAREEGYTAYVTALITDWEDRALGGLAEHELIDAARNILREKQKKVYVFTRELIHVLQSCGYACAAISGSPKQIVDEFTKLWGFEMALSTQLELDQHGVFLRNQKNAVKPCLNKGKAFEEIVEALHADPMETIVVGDSISDLSMLQKAQWPIAFNPEQELLQSARQVGIPVVLERKNVILSLRTQPTTVTREDLTESFLFKEILFKNILPEEVASRLTERLTALRLLLR